MVRHSNVLSRSVKAKAEKPKSAVQLPAKPYPDFPLGPSVHGYWVKKIRGKIYHFGRWARVVKKELIRLPYDPGWQEALKQYEQQRDALYSGRTPSLPTDARTVRDLANSFLTAKTRALGQGQLTARSFADYRNTTDRLIRVLGRDRPIDDLKPGDFALLLDDIASTWGPVAVGNEVQRTRTIFKFGFDAGLIDKPVRYGPEFVKPSRKVLRKAKSANGEKFFESDEIRAMISAAGVPLRAMILLGINCGFGNSDCGTLPLVGPNKKKPIVDLDGGWISYDRPKTGVKRKCWLWPETVQALREAIADRPKHKNAEHADLVFITKYGMPWAKDAPESAISQEFLKLKTELKIDRPGVGFYGLRHSFRTEADATRDFPAIDLIMGHADSSMAGHYRERIDDERIKAVAEYVRKKIIPIGGAR